MMISDGYLGGAGVGSHMSSAAITGLPDERDELGNARVVQIALRALEGPSSKVDDKQLLIAN